MYESKNEEIIRTDTLNSFSYRRIAKKSAQTPREYAQYLCFNVIVGSNDLCAEQQYTNETSVELFLNCSEKNNKKK